MTRIWTDARRAEAVGLAHALGDKEASKRTGIPARTIRRWLQLLHKGDERALAILDAPTREQVAAKLWEGVTVGTEAVVAGLSDPRSRLGDKARALEVLATQHSLLTGGVTSRTETTGSRITSPQSGTEADSIQWWEQAIGGPLSDAEKRVLRDAIDAVEEWMILSVVDELRAARAEGRDPVNLRIPHHPNANLTDVRPALLTDGQRLGSAPERPRTAEPPSRLPNLVMETTP
jgi:hypothetical protein